MVTSWVVTLVAKGKLIPEVKQQQEIVATCLDHKKPLLVGAFLCYTKVIASPSSLPRLKSTIKNDIFWDNFIF